MALHLSVLPFIAGVIVALGIGALTKILVGMKLNLYLMTQDPGTQSSTIVPLTSELKKSRLWKTIIKRKWEENIELNLVGYSGLGSSLEIGYHLWDRFYLKLLNENPTVYINGKHLKPGTKYLLRTGMTLQVGGQNFKVLISLAKEAETQKKSFQYSEIGRIDS